MKLVGEEKKVWFTVFPISFIVFLITIAYTESTGLDTKGPEIDPTALPF